MKRLFFLLSIPYILGTSCQGQGNRIENELMDCVYKSYSDRGADLKKTITDFESLLINEGILKDNSGKSYRTIFLRIANNENISFNPSQSFLLEWQKVDRPDLQKVQACHTKLIKRFPKSKTKEEDIEMIMDSLIQSKNISASAIANGFLTVLDDQDFELDYYKFRFLSVFNMLNANDVLERALPKPENKKYDLTDALKIHLDENNEITVFSEKVTIQELKEKIREFESKNKSNSVMVLTTSKQAKYSSYMQVQSSIVEEINSLRNEISLKKYNTDFQNLSSLQAEQIKNIYPLNLVEK